MSTTTKIIAASGRVDWKQVALHAGDAPCFHVEDDGRFCLRAILWTGHQGHKRSHLFEPLGVAFTRVAQDVLGEQSTTGEGGGK